MPRSEVDAAHQDAVAAGAADLGAHPAEHVRQLGHLGLPGGVLEQRLAARERGGHHHVLGAVHGAHVERDARADQRRAGRFDVAVVEPDLRAQRFQALQVLVHRPHADRAAAGLGDARAAEARQQRAQHQERGAHLAHDVVGRDQVRDASARRSGRVWGSAGSQSAPAPSARSSSSMASTSRRRGTRRSTVSPSASSAAAISASVEFLDPETATSPDRRAPPRTTIRSMSPPLRGQRRARPKPRGPGARDRAAAPRLAGLLRGTSPRRDPPARATLRRRRAPPGSRCAATPCASARSTAKPCSSANSASARLVRQLGRVASRPAAFDR